VTSQSRASFGTRTLNLENSAVIMSPVPSDMAPGTLVGRTTEPKELKLNEWQPNELILEAWAQGLLVGSLVILSFITLANMRRGVLLHKVCATPMHAANNANNPSVDSP
jgi:hypothetical protein